jgi:flagellar hook protein FlgE
MVLRAMFSGVSGLRAEGEALGVVGDNIANVNTVGFKSQRSVFQDVLGHSILAGSSTALPGSGVRMGGVQQLFTQGSLSNTGVSTDVALNGDGFLVVAGTVDGLTSDFYTRAGQLKVDGDGSLINQQGLKAQGYLANADGTLQAAVGDLAVPTASLAPFATTDITVTANLDSRAPVLVFDIANPAGTSNGSTSITVFDSLGAARTLDIYFNNVGGNLYDYNVVADGGDLAGGTAGVDQLVGSGSLQFTSDGALDTHTTPQLAVSFAGGSTAGQLIDLNFGQDIQTDGTTGLSGTTQFASDMAPSSQSQNGFSSGEFTGLSIDGTGLVQGLYTNGEKIPIGQLAIAKFRSNDGLARAGQGLWIETRESGTAALGTAGAGGRASVTGGALESSNVDLGEEFVGLIQHQRSFSANSRTITTADEMLQELINIKR